MQLDQTPEDLIKEAMRCETVEELMKLAKDNDIELTEEEAVKLLGVINPKSGELSDSELDAVTGGQDKGGGICRSCGLWFEWMPVGDSYVCRNCGYRKRM